MTTAPDAIAALSNLGAPPMPSAPPPPEEEDGGIPWGRWISAIKRYKYLMVLIIIAGSGLGYVATKFLSPQYEVQATIWVGSESPSGQEGVGGKKLLNQQAWTELFKSFTVVDSVVKKRQLYLALADRADSSAFVTFQPRRRLRGGAYELKVDATGTKYTLLDGDGKVVDKGVVGDSIGRGRGWDWVPPAGSLGKSRTIAFSATTPREASLTLLNNLTTVLARESSFLRLSLSGVDPVLTADVMNTWLDEYVGAATRLKKKNLIEFANIIGTQLSFAELSLRSAETAYENFRVNTITLPTEQTALPGGVKETQDPIFRNFFDQRVAYDNARRDREQLQRIQGALRQGALPPEQILSSTFMPPGAEALKKAIDDLNANQATLRAAQQYYTDEHKTVIDLKSNIQFLQAQTIPGLLASLIDQIQRKEQELQDRIDDSGKELKNIPMRQIEEMRLKRDVVVAEDIYTRLQNRYAEAKLSEAGAQPDVSILDIADVPQNPVSNNKQNIMLAGFGGSIVLAIAIAILLDKVDRRVRYPDQVTKELGLEIIGALPTIRIGSFNSPEEAAQVVEAFRAIRLSVRHAYQGQGPVMLTISSPGPGDGKSLVASNLALSFAEAGYRTVLIDGDIRRGEMHRTFAVEARPGLLDYLVGEATKEQIVRTTSHDNLMLVPRGARRHRGPELLASEAMLRLLASFRSEFDVVISDSPPLGAGIDPFALGTATGNLLLVVRAGETDRKMAQAKIQLLERLPVRVLGVVLNSIHAEGVYRYYSYIEGYETVTDDDAPGLEKHIGELTAKN